MVFGFWEKGKPSFRGKFRVGEPWELNTPTRGEPCMDPLYGFVQLQLRRRSKSRREKIWIRTKWKISDSGFERN